jgi:predicted MFS family arabinose efflux permease
MNIIFATGTSLGAPLGGVVADYFGWRWSFGIQIPLIIVSTLIVCFRLHLPARTISTQTTKEKLMRVDFAGATTLVSTLRSLTQFLIRGLDSLCDVLDIWFESWWE